jgi:CRP-like cAMP-binding protein
MKVIDTTGLFKVLSVIHPLSDAFKVSLKNELVRLVLPKNHLLLEAPKIAEFVYFIEKGFAMSYIYLDDRKMTEAFWKPRQIMTSPYSFFEQAPAQEYIQLAEKSELLCLSRNSLKHLFDRHPEAHLLYHKIMNRHFAQCRARIHDIQLLSASRRLADLIMTYPNIEQIVTQENIASYLAITPQSLSRLKRRNP